MSDPTNIKSNFSLDGYYDQVIPFATIESGGKSIHYSVPSKPTLGLAQCLESKEPETLEWIAGFNANDVLIDIGANVGMYTIWAAATVGVQVVAFEPESLNYSVLNQNIVLNNLQEKVAAYCLALSNSNGLGTLYLNEFIAGASCHNFGEEVDHNLNSMQASFKQGCLSFTLDSLIADSTVPFPTHIKIDVDGIEHLVIEGAKNTIRDARVKSILIELNTSLKQHQDLIEELTGLGYMLDVEQVYAAAHGEKGFNSISNYIFFR
jgi:FkbM family methyltransferase